MELKINEGVKPKRRINMVRWFAKHGISTDVVSLDFGTTRAIESQVNNN